MTLKVLFVLTGLLTSLLIEGGVLGDAPVVDIGPQEGVVSIADESQKADGVTSSVLITPTIQALSERQRLDRLEQQMNNFVNMNLPQRVTDLQQQLAQVRGQLQEQQRDLQLFSNQLRSFYSDLNQRITQVKNLNSDIPNESTKSNVNSISSKGSIQLQDSTAYQKALNFLTKREFDKAEAAFQNYLNDYPNGNYVANAHYWLGEIYLEHKDMKKAALEFKIIISKFAKSEKALDAQLKLAVIHAQNGQVAQAKQELTEIKKLHSNSTVGQLASIRLQQLEAATSKNP